MKILDRSVLTAVMAVVMHGATPALADQAHSWVSSTGTGTACTRTAPCAHLVSAQAVTQAGGVISILDSMDDQQQFQIFKSLTLRAESIDAGITFAGPAGLGILVNAGPADSVVLEGLRLNSMSIFFGTGGHLHIVRCVITNENNPNDDGIFFTPNGASKLSVTDTVISNIGNGSGGGIVVRPDPGGSARVNLERVIVNGGAFGVAADGSLSTAGINMTIHDSMIGGNSQDGVVATSGGGAPIGVMLKNVKTVNNNIGVRSIGPNVTVRLDHTTVIGNGTGLSFSAAGNLLSFGNNQVEANASNGTFSGTVALK